MKSFYGGILVLGVIVAAMMFLSSREGFAPITPASPASPAPKPAGLLDPALAPSPSLKQATATASFSPASSAAPGAPADLTSPSDPSVVPLSETGYEAMSLKQRSNLLKEIQMMVRNELLSSRQLEKPDQKRDHAADPIRETNGACDADRQGREYKRRCPQAEGEGEGEEEYRCPKNPDGSCPPVPDLSEYIRKDSIPCWGCSLK